MNIIPATTTGRTIAVLRARLHPLAVMGAPITAATAIRKATMVVITVTITRTAWAHSTAATMAPATTATVAGRNTASHIAVLAFMGTGSTVRIITGAAKPRETGAAMRATGERMSMVGGGIDRYGLIKPYGNEVRRDEV
jgi:hypothetical protein